MPKVKLTHKNGKWYRNGVEIKNPRTYTFIDTNTGKKVMGLHNWNPPTPYIDMVKEDLQHRKKRYKENMDAVTPPFPVRDSYGNYLPQVSNVPANMLDTIAINTGRSRTNIADNLGLALHEAGWLNDVIRAPYMVRKQSLVPTDFTDYPEDAYLRQLESNFDYSYGDGMDKFAAEQQAKEDYRSGNYWKFIDKHPRATYHPNFLVDNYIRWANVPDDYDPINPFNTIDVDFTPAKQEVRAVGEEFLGRPEVQEWWNNEGVKYYNKGLKERFK